MKDVEIEIKVRISDSANLLEFLADKAKFQAENYQKDEYFTPAHRDFVATRPIREWLRLRHSGTNVITYKNWHYEADGKTSYFADEYETPVGDIDQLRKIFLALNFKPVITVEKTRRTWRYENYEIALDRVTSLGDFVEVEFKGESSQTPKAITDDMIKFLQNIGCGAIQRSLFGYPFQLLHPDETKFESV